MSGNKAIITPVHKKGSATDCSNYRPKYIYNAVIPVHWQIFIGHSPKKYRTSDENIGFIGHVSVYQYTSAMRGI